MLHLKDVLLVVVRDGQPRSLQKRSHMTSAHRGRRGPRGVGRKADNTLETVNKVIVYKVKSLIKYVGISKPQYTILE